MKKELFFLASASTCNHSKQRPIPENLYRDALQFHEPMDFDFSAASTEDEDNQAWAFHTSM